MSDFKISTVWSPAKGNSEADATLCNLTIEVGGHVVTEFVDLHRQTVSKHLEVPAYYLAEWVAENWWPLLWEPRKSEDDSDSPEFLARHSFLTAQHGFALPKVLIVALGRLLQVSSSARDVPLADVRFRRGGSASCVREDVEAELSAFVTSVLARLEAAGVRSTYLHDAWSVVKETDAEEAQFCKFVGALGRSPYEVDDATAALIERLLPTLGERLLMDLCLVSPAQTFPIIAEMAEKAAELTKYASLSTLSPLASLKLPHDNISVPAYRRGVNAAQRVKQRLGISETDPRGATRVFEALKIDTSARAGSTWTNDEIAITGAVVREETDMKVALLQPTESKRRFAAARAIFSGWSAELPNESRLLTSAVTRDQQANRAFAAELTAPRALIKKHAQRGRLSPSAIFELAADLQIGADVVSKQAVNNGVEVFRA
jgi:hypothetical protein